MKKHLVLFVIFSTVLFGLHYLINSSFENALSLIDLISSHVTLYVSFSLGIYALHLINSIDKDKVGITFLALSVLKMLIALTFILIQIKGNNKPNTLAYHFLSLYFIDLIFVSIVTFQIINKNNYAAKEELKS